MSITIICPGWNPEPFVNAINEVDPSVEVQIWPNEKNKGNVEFALCWKQPEGVLQEYPNLQCVSSMGAGIDHMFNDSLFPTDVSVVRLVDPQMAQSMFEYICSACMFYFRRADVFRAQQDQSQWRQRAPRLIKNTTIGIMGLGNLGEYSATRLVALGFTVVGWSRSEKTLTNVATYAGEGEFEEFLSRTNILVCLLPLTKKTRGILNLSLFNRMPKGGYLINVARGQHLIEEDLITALDQEQMRGAYLDVFNQEPLPQGHPFWGHEKITITPHCSSMTMPKSVAPQIVQNYHRLKEGKELLNQVDMEREY